MRKNLNFTGRALLLLMLFGLLMVGSCKKQQSIDSENLAGSKKIGATVNMLNLTLAQVNSLRDAFVKEKKVYAEQYGSIKSFAAAVADNNSQVPTYKGALNEVMRDEFMSSLLNQDGEITVDGQFYKVTVFGTFKTSVANKGNIDAMLNRLYQKYDVKKINPDKPEFDLSEFYANGSASIKKVKNTTGLAPVDDGCNEVAYVSMSDDIVYYPTFENMESLCDIPGGGGGGGGGYTPPATFFDNDHPMFYPGNMYTADMVNPNGSFWVTIFENSTLYNDFDSEYRTSVLFYNRNYGFIKTLGIKVKQQKSGWFWYNSTPADVISAGWETIRYRTIASDPNKRYYATMLEASTTYFNSDVLPGNIQILKAYNGNTEFYMPLIVANGLPIPNLYKSMGPKGYVKFIWDLIKKKIEENNNDAGWPGIPVIDDKGVVLSQMKTIHEWEAARRAALIASEDQSGELELVLPAYQQVAYNTDIIDIPLDHYYSDISTLGLLVTTTIIEPSAGGGPLLAFAKDEFSKSFKVIKAEVYGSSSRNGMWRGVKVVHN